jgi:MFS family permease
MSLATSQQRVSPNYKWIALSNTTVAILLATIDSSIMLIALPEIFRGIMLNPLAPGNTFYLLWMILGFQIVSSVLVVSFGRLGDISAASKCIISAMSSTRSRPSR